MLCYSRRFRPSLLWAHLMELFWYLVSMFWRTTIFCKLTMLSHSTLQGYMGMPSIHGSLTCGIISFPQSWNSHQCNVSVLDAKQALQIVLGTTAQGDIVYCFLSCTGLVWLHLTWSDYIYYLACVQVLSMVL